MGTAPDHKKKPQKPTPQWVKDQNEFSKTKYPSCKGTFDDCPEVIDANEVARVCKMCPIFVEGRK